MEIIRSEYHGRSHFTIEVKRTDCRRDFEFRVHDHRVEIIPGKNHGSSKNHLDWYTSLTPEERAQVLEMITKVASEGSLDGDRFKSAAVGVVKNPAKDAPPDKKHLLFLGVNTERTAKPYFKDCAEQNMVNAATNALAQSQTRKHKEADPTPIRVEMLGLYATREPDPAKPDDKGVHGACPCGKCTDMLAKVMVPGGQVLAFSKRPANLRQKLVKAHSYANVNPGETWDTDIDTLNRARSIQLTDDEAADQRQGMEDIVAEAGRIVRGELSHWRLLGAQLLDRAAPIAAANVKAERHSVAELDAAEAMGDFPFWAKLYMERQIQLTLADRMQAVGRTGLEPDTKAWVQEYVKTINCCIIKLDDGTYRFGIDSLVKGEKGKARKGDSAYVNPEVSALSQAIDKLGTNGVTGLWAANFSPTFALDGVMITSPKEGLERLLKNPSITGAPLVSHFIPLLPQDACKKRVGELSEKYSFLPAEIYPAAFAGTLLMADRVSGRATSPAIAI